MANITPKKNKQGEIISYQIRVYKGRDGNGKILKPYLTTWKVPKGKTQRQINKELQLFANNFEKQCKDGLISENPKLT